MRALTASEENRLAYSVLTGPDGDASLTAYWERVQRDFPGNAEAILVAKLAQGAGRTVTRNEEHAAKERANLALSIAAKNDHIQREAALDSRIATAIAAGLAAAIVG